MVLFPGAAVASITSKQGEEEEGLSNKSESKKKGGKQEALVCRMIELERTRGCSCRSIE